MLELEVFKPGITPVLTSGACIGSREKQKMYESVASGWLTGGKYIEEFEQKLAKVAEKKYALSCNSGSSANLLAVAAMVESGVWKAGDEILCLAASFPTTINPLLLYGLVPVFVDIRNPNYEVNMGEMLNALSKKCKGVMMAHTLGIPYDLEKMEHFCRTFNLTLIEDCCDALGSYWDGKQVGGVGKLMTCSFYPAHHITTGEGGAVLGNDKHLMTVLRSLRDWGRSCYCDPGKENTCGVRFDCKYGTLPQGFDHKYTYSHLGFNLKMIDVSAA